MKHHEGYLNNKNKTLLLRSRSAIADEILEPMDRAISTVVAKDIQSRVSRPSQLAHGDRSALSHKLGRPIGVEPYRY